MAMSIRERTREVAVLKTLGFTRQRVLGLFVSEAVALSLAGGLIRRGLGVACSFTADASQSPSWAFSSITMKVTPGTAWLVALLVAGAGGIGEFRWCRLITHRR